MKRTLRGCKSSGRPDLDELARQAQNLDPSQLQDVQQVVEQYKGKSEQELFAELRAARENGVIDPAELNGVAQKLAPCLPQTKNNGYFRSCKGYNKRRPLQAMVISCWEQGCHGPPTSGIGFPQGLRAGQRHPLTTSSK